MNWWLDLGRVYYRELSSDANWAEVLEKLNQKIDDYQNNFRKDLKSRIQQLENDKNEKLEKENDNEKKKKLTEDMNKKIKALTEKEQRLDACRNVTSKTLLNNPIFNKAPKSFEHSKKRLNEIFKNDERETVVNCSFCGNKTTPKDESIASRTWLVSGGWEKSPLYAGGGMIQPRICIECKRLSILASFQAYELFSANQLPFIIYNPDLNLYKKLLDNLLLRKDLNLNFEKASSVFLSLGSMLIYPEFDNQGNISSFDQRPLLPKESLILMNLTGLLRIKSKEQYILQLVEKYKDKSGRKLIADFLKKQSKLSLSEVITAFYALVKAYKGGIGMTKDFFDLGKELGNNLGDKAYSVALKLYKSLRDATQLQKQLIGSYIYLKEPMPKELTQITESEDHALAFIMGIMNTIQK